MEGSTSSISSINFIKDYYSEKYCDYKADFICSRHVLEHIQNPRQFLENTRLTIDKHLNTIVFFEVPNTRFIIKDLSIWDLIYEHCSYFSNISLVRLFELSGFEILDIEETFEKQFIQIVARPAKNHHAATPQHLVI